MMGGEIGVKGVEGEGTTFFFTIRLPASGDPCHSQVLMDENPGYDPGMATRLPLKILLAEDNFIDQ